MRRMREIRKEKGFTLEQLSKETGISMSVLRSHEMETYNTNHENLSKISKILEVTVSELNQDCKEYKKGMKCLNEACLLNLGKKCSNNVVLSGKAPCYGKDKIQAKESKINYKSTKALFLD